MEHKTFDSRALGLPFRKLDSIDLPANGGCSFGLIGSTRSGKSTAMIWLYEKFFSRHITVMTTGSIQADIYGPLRKQCAISPDFYPELIKESMLLNQKTKNHYPILHILDDMLDGKNTKALSKLLTIGRNSALSTIICAQELTILNAIGRTNLNYICCFRLNSDIAVEKVVRNWLRHILPGKTIEDKCAAYKLLTQDHHFIVVDTLMDEVFHCKLDI
ncbi:MAG: hypothetical protein F2801_02315 [Actinobacteria bacterium]|nr:hypothetical protein [Actinomycetota bacterium]